MDPARGRGLPPHTVTGLSQVTGPVQSQPYRQHQQAYGTRPLQLTACVIWDQLSFPTLFPPSHRGNNPFLNWFVRDEL